jgi:uncharacterized protein YqjF (DUF2071 family)
MWPDLAAEPVSALTPRPLGRGMVMAQRWRDVAFVHWAVEPARVGHLFPAGTRPDVIDRMTWVGLVPFRMVGAGIGRRYPVRYLGSFPETNVRLYSVDTLGRRGIVFLSLDASRLAVVLGARAAYGLPYQWSRMHLHRRGQVLTYVMWRRWPGPRGCTSRVVVRVGEVVERPSATELFLTARWGLHHRWAGRTLYTPNEHEPWPLHRAELLEVRDELLPAAGLAELAGRAPDLVHWSPGVASRFGVPMLVPPPTMR